MGLIDFLKKAADKASTFAQETQENKIEYENMTDSELIDEYKRTGNMSKKFAIASIMQERGYVLKKDKWLKL